MKSQDAQPGTVHTLQFFPAEAPFTLSLPFGAAQFKNSRQGSEWEKSSKQMGHELKIAGLGDGHMGHLSCPLGFPWEPCLVNALHMNPRLRLCFQGT